MKSVYTSQDRFMVYIVKNKLELAGLDCHIRNEYSSGAAGDIAPIDTWPEVWLNDDNQYEEAKEILELTILNTDNPSVDWTCKQYNEVNGTAFELCWNCGHTH